MRFAGSNAQPELPNWWRASAALRVPRSGIAQEGVAGVAAVQEKTNEQDQSPLEVGFHGASLQATPQWSELFWSHGQPCAAPQCLVRSLFVVPPYTTEVQNKMLAFVTLCEHINPSSTPSSLRSWVVTVQERHCFYIFLQ